MAAQRNNELIDRIKETWNNYEEPYHLGAWERFREKRKKHLMASPWIKRLGYAASIIFIVVTTLLIDRIIQTGETGQVKQEKKPVTHDQVNTEIPKDHTQQPGNNDTGGSYTSSFTPGRKNNDAPPGNTFPLTTGTSQQEMERLDDLKIQAITIPENPEFSVIVNSYEYPSQEADKQFLLPEVPPDNYKKTGSLRWGFAMAPTFSGSQSKADMGLSGGITTDWIFSRKFSFSTGLFMTQSRLNYDEPVAVSPRTAASLNSMEVSLISMEIPVNVQYHINEQFYVSTGFSSATFIREAYEYTYAYESIRPMQDMEGEGPQLLLEPVTTLETEETSEPALNSFHFPAFYNLSLGYQYHLENKYVLSVEPFVKLPMTGIATKEIRYTTGGVQLKIKF